MSLLKRFFSGADNKGNPLFEQIFRWIGNEVKILGGNSNEKFIEKGYAANNHIYSVVSLLAEYESLVRFKCYEVRKDGEQVLLPDDNDVNKILENPNSYQTWQEFVIAQAIYFELTGNSYLYGSRMQERKGVITSLHVAPSNMVEIKSKGWQNPIEGYLINTSYDYNKLFYPGDIMHLKYFNPRLERRSHPQLYGLSPLEAGSRTLHKSNEAYDRAIALYQNGIPAGILSAADQFGADLQQIEKFESDWFNTFGGGKNGGRMLRSKDNVKWQEIGLKISDLDLDKANLSDLKDICRIYKVPVPLVTLDDTGNLTSNDISGHEKRFWINTMQPKINNKAAKLSKFLLPSYEKYLSKKLIIKPDYSNIEALKSNNIELRKSLIEGIAAGLYTRRQVLRMLGEDVEKESKHLDEYLTDFNIKKSNEGQTAKSQSK